MTHTDADVIATALRLVRMGVETPEAGVMVDPRLLQPVAEYLAGLAATILQEYAEKTGSDVKVMLDRLESRAMLAQVDIT